ncbi:hypothetical protein SNE26_23815 [Mucilaginibacter sp. cycad4]|uniref:hypothetical protein n=1 Tax=Mucilaginibacter sp. cycad4 TaxID=3342096 RepID=UPI002AABE6F1|nr:hypothetical protein [Mucilaginibacter gossypii]WPU99043.1 hypothetical protein SNE26_23815 [Mucilaginibacter gossypii]
MNFNYNNFISEIHKDFAEDFHQSEIKSLLDLGTELDKDTPLSTGKRLEVNYIAFSGKKVTEEKQEYSDQLINYSQEIYSGVNMWIADNLRGKSSIFKIIKFGLTGDDSLKPNISKWLQHILLVFSINEKKYSVYINKEKKPIQASFYNKEIRIYPADDEHLDDRLFLATSKDELQRQLKDFFFHQFDYYSLRWTQKSPVKESDDLIEAGASWLTYFKSIFLESKDTNELMYGAQGTKVFQMLLGLYLTSSINKLTVGKDKLLHQKGKQQSFLSRESTEKQSKKTELQRELTDLDQQLEELAIAEKQTSNVNALVLEYEGLVKDIDEENTKRVAVNNSLQEARKNKDIIDRRKQFIDDEIRRLRKEAIKTEKQYSDVKEYLEIGVFFSNLEVKTCPSCSHPVSKDKKTKAASAHTCALCTDDISKDEPEVDTGNLESKLVELEKLKESLENGIGELESEYLMVQSKSVEYYNDIIKREQQYGGLRDVKEINSRLNELQNAISEERKKFASSNETKTEMLNKKAVLNFRISQLNEEPEPIGDQKIEKKIQLFTKAIASLNKIRYDEGQTVLRKLADLMTAEAQSLGLRITEININDRFDIKYKQDGDFLSFSEIAEGEQLRAKLAFYLSLIQLDIEYNYGRHSRFLMIDSPGKEEGDKNYLEGLSRLIKELESRFGDSLQILIGTAERSLENTVKNQNVFPAQSFVF